MRTATQRLCATGFVLAVCCAAPSAHAQAWLPEKGTLNLGVSYYSVFNKYHWQADGSQGDFGHTRVNSIGLSGSYSFSDRFSIAAGIPYVRTQYRGAFRHPTEIDDGHDHATFTDLRVEMHYQLQESPIAFAPYVGVVVPTHHYETLGHAAPGRGLNEYWLGFYAAKVLDEWIPRTYVQLRYNYAFVEKVAGIAHDRSNADLEIGYFFTPELSVRGLAYWAQTHGGIDIPVPRNSPLFPFHDKLAAERYVNVGGGISWEFSRSADVSLFYVTAVHGRNGHKLDEGLNISFGYRPGAR
jgi:hypothetical protein